MRIPAMQPALTILRLLRIAVIAGAIAVPTLADEVPLATKANAWKTKQPIPAELLAFRDLEYCVSDGTDSTAVFSDITNYPLLRAIISHPCDAQVFDCAVKRALLLVGPTRFFRDLTETYARMPELLSEPRHQTLQKRAGLPHVHVDGVFIDDHDMSRGKAAGVFANIAAELRAGGAFEIIRRKYQDAYNYPYTESFSDGKTVVLHRTRVGYYGDFVVSEAEHTARPLRSADLPDEHVRPLLAGRVGEIIILRDEAEHWSILYRIREAYSPPDSAPANERASQADTI